jgi:hypothetical protein
VGNTFRPCNIHKAVKDELEPVFLQRLQEDQERYDAGLNITPEMAPEKDRGPIFPPCSERTEGWGTLLHPVFETDRNVTKANVKSSGFMGLPYQARAKRSGQICPESNAPGGICRTQQD